MIKGLKLPKIPAMSMFKPLSVQPRDWLTDAEFLLGVLKKLNETIVQVNKNTEFIENYEDKIAEIERELALLRSEMTDFKETVTSDIEERFTAIKVDLQAQISAILPQANAYTDATASVLRQEIQQISVGEITLYDPTTGQMNNLQNIINNMYSSSREEAITASEYDTLQLTAAVYDGKNITAYDYDRYAKTLLITQ